MTAYTLLRPLVVNKELQQPGAVVILTDAQAQWLHGLGIIRISGVAVPKAQPQPALFRAPPRKAGGCRGCGWR